MQCSDSGGGSGPHGLSANRRHSLTEEIVDWLLTDVGKIFKNRSYISLVAVKSPVCWISLMRLFHAAMSYSSFAIRCSNFSRLMFALFKVLSFTASFSGRCWRALGGICHEAGVLKKEDGLGLDGWAGSSWISMLAGWILSSGSLFFAVVFTVSCTAGGCCCCSCCCCCSEEASAPTVFTPSVSPSWFPSSSCIVSSILVSSV